MKYLYTDAGLKILESVTFTDTLYAFDFDGTLAPIVSSPESARATDLTESLLVELSELVPVVVISGRSIADLRTRVKLNPDYLIGNHGLEGVNSKPTVIHNAEKISREWFEQLQSAPIFKKDPGVLIEDKTYSIAIHYRKSRNKKSAKNQLYDALESLKPSPRIILGKCVMNLIPAGGPHKGVALLEAMMQMSLKCAFYIGDDDTDEDVFALPDDRILTVRVGMKKTSQAQYYLKRQTEMNRLLKLLIRMNRNKR